MTIVTEKIHGTPIPTDGGVLFDLPDAEYRQAPGVSNSMLKQLRDRWSPALAMKRLAMKSEPSDAMMFGKALHASLLTPELLPTWRIAPEGMTFRTKEGKAWRDAQVAAGLDVLNYAAGIRLTKTIEAFKNHSLAAETLASGNPEVSVFAPYSLGGTVLRKARMDFVNDGSTIIDLKSAADCSPACIGKRDEFASQLYDLDYDMQAAYYLDLWNTARPDDRKEHFVFVAMDWDEDTEHVGIRVLQCDETVIRSGRDKYVEALAKWIECMTSNQFPGYAESVTMLSVPEWIAKKYRTIAAISDSPKETSTEGEK
jgi:exodeoxyribonuclease VIII